MKSQKGTVTAPAATESAVTIENPLLEQVEVKTYAQGNLQVDPTKLQQAIPEPQFTAPNIDAEKDLFAEEEEEGQQGQKAGSTGQAAAPEFNQTLNELSPKDQERSAEHAASVIFAAYQKLHDAGNWWISISDDKLIKLQMEGQLDTSVLVPYTSEEWMPLMEFVQTYNKQAKEFFIIDPEWRATVEPALIRVLKKYKIGMTDEQFLVAKFGEDLAVKGIRANMMRKTSKEILEFAIQTSREARQQQQPQAQGPLTAVPGGQSAQQQPVYNEGPQTPLTAVPGGQAAYQSPVDMQDHVGEELRTQAGGAVSMGGVEHSEPPQFGSKQMLKNLNRVSKKRAAKKPKQVRTGKSRT